MKSVLNKLRNKLIIFEGSDETGKTTVAQLLNTFLNENGVESIFTFQPGDSNWGQYAPTIRSFCKDQRWDLHELSRFFAFQLDKVEHVSKVIMPNRLQKKTIISDRWSYSTYAYQFHGQELAKKYEIPEETVKWFMTMPIFNIVPDYVFYFPEKIKKHTRENDSNDLFDEAGEAFFNRVHLAYEDLAKNNQWIRILPENSAEKTMLTILETLKNKD